MKKVAVIILNWNGEKLLREFLPSVVANTNPSLADVIVADNGSTDSSREVLAKEFPEVKVLKFSENLGFAEGYNRALRETGYPLTVLLNSDVETPAGWLEPLVEFMDAHGEAGGCQPKLLAYKQKDTFEYAGAAGGFIDRNGFPYCRGRIFSTVEKDDGQYDSPCEIFWATGACLMVRTELYNRAGGLDKLFFAHMEEIDLCCRIAAAGYRICALTDSHVFHMGGASLEQGNPRKTYLNFRNNLLLIHKNMTRRGGSRMLLKRRLADTLAFGMYLIKGDLANARAILKAHNDFRRMRREYTDFPDRDILPTLPGHKHSAVAARYIKRKKSLPL